MNQVFKGEDTCATSPPPLHHTLTQQNDLSLNRGLLLEEDLFSLKNASLTSVTVKI